MTHYILETTIYDPVESLSLPIYPPYMRLRKRIGNAEHPGVWLMRGKVKVEHCDSFEHRHVVIRTSSEATAILQRYKGQSITIEYPTGR